MMAMAPMMPVVAMPPMMPSMAPTRGRIIIIVVWAWINVNPRRGHDQGKRGRWGHRKAHHNPDPRRVRKSWCLGYKETKPKNRCQ
jgi:hypothetical protein